MNSSRQIILDNIRSGMKKALLPEASANAPDLVFPGNTGGVEKFVEEFEKVSGKAFRVATLPEAFELVIKILAGRGWRQTLIWERLLEQHPEFRQSLAQAGIEAISEGQIRHLAGIPVGITGAQAAIADTGTLVLQNSSGQPAFASLLPETHLALLSVKDIHPNLQAYLDSVDDLREHILASSNQVFITGPSRTGDIELNITLGVHGPREVIAIIWDQE
jgi:L-lactate dehydrogenase complex protein LldG